MLSKAGRVTLIKSISICKEIDKIHKKFLWGSNSERKKLHLVNWDEICRNKSSGGLGIPKSHERNLAFLTSLYWRALTKKESVWAKVCTTRMNLSSGKNSVSGKCLAKGSFWALQGSKMLLNFGNNTNFWNEEWSTLGPIRSLIQGPLNVGESNMFVVDMRKNSVEKSRVKFNVPHGNLFINILHQIWTSRNQLVFSSKEIHVNSCLRFAVMRVAEFSHLVIADNIASFVDLSFGLGYAVFVVCNDEAF
ncbi:reverse transcriptase [Senna tora]|uniref:Reverse transcriptase n=1 Tax=Senna tora TaxID=362788 RepID=A0A834W953_9FABA|nr:reverse transcriptase [Senna tora]